MLEKALESPLDCKEIQPVHTKGDQSWIFIGRTDAEVEAPILWPPDANSRRIGKDPDGGKDCRQEEKGTTEAEMVGWHHASWLNGHEFEQILGHGKGQGSLAYCGPWGCKELDTTERLNNNNTYTCNWKKKRFTYLFTYIYMYISLHIYLHLHTHTLYLPVCIYFSH